MIPTNQVSVEMEERDPQLTQATSENVLILVHFYHKSIMLRGILRAIVDKFHAVQEGHLVFKNHLENQNFL